MDCICPASGIRGEVTTLDLTPVPKPRMTRADKWKQRPCVLRYWAFCEELRLKLPRDFDLTGKDITFILPMPKSWSKKKKIEMDGMPHMQRPDLSNLLKALEDAHQAEDSTIYGYTGLWKLWGREGAIVIR